MLTQTIKARVSPDTIVQLDGIVATSVGDRSDHIRQAIVEYIARHQANSSVPVALLSMTPENAGAAQQ